MLATRIRRKPSGASKNVEILKRVLIFRHPSEGDDTASGVYAAQLPLPFSTTPSDCSIPSDVRSLGYGHVCF